MTFGVDGANGTTERMRIAASGRVGIGTTDPQLQLVVSNGGAGGLELDPSGTMQSYNRSTSAYQSVTLDGSINIFRISGTERMRIDASGQVGIGTTAPPQLLAVGNTTDQFGAGVSGAVTTAYFGSPSSGSGGIKRIAYDRSTGSMNFIGGTVASASTQMALTVDGFLEAVYSDDVVALGNSGTATNIDLRQGNVFTATLTGNCTFTLTNPNANTNRGSSFTLILTNDGTAGRTVAWAGGTFRFPGGAASLSRTTTANAVDIWVFFTPNNGTTWYGNISMKNMIA
jgi:hypothetical protein